jgi:hypothetical protein
MPEGHPPLDASDRPRRAAPPQGHGESLAEPPEDTVEDDSTLPRGSLVVTVKDLEDRPVPRAPLKISVLHQSVARGDSREELERTTDESGTASFEGLTFGSATSYRVITTRGPAIYSVGPFALSDQRGKRVVLHSYEVATGIDEVLVGMQAAVYVSLREDSLSVEHLFSVFNLGRVAWVPNITITLPEGFKAFNKAEAAEGDVQFTEVKGRGAALKGTVTPGRHDATFRYQVPLENREEQTIQIELPPRVAQARVMTEASRSMGLKVAGFPAAEKSQNRDGKKILITGRQVSREEGGLKRLEITVTGLPTPGPGRWIAVVLTATALLGAFAYVYQRRDTREMDDDTREDLVEAREALLAEIIELERAQRRGEIGPRTYGRIRRALLDSLARIVAMLDTKPAAAAATPPKVTPKRQRPRAGSTGTATPR